MKTNFSCGLAVLWSFTLTLPILGFFVIVDNPIKDLETENKIQRKLFQFLPHGIENDQRVFCEITFADMALDTSFKPPVITTFNPDTPQKVQDLIIKIVLQTLMSQMPMIF